MHEIPEPHPLLALPTDLAFLPLGVTLRNQLPGAIEVITQILGDGAGLGQHERLVGVLGLDGDNGRFAKRVDFLELRGSKHVGSALEGLEFIRDAEFFEEPEDALGARLLEPVKSDLCAVVCVGHGEGVVWKIK